MTSFGSVILNLKARNVFPWLVIVGTCVVLIFINILHVDTNVLMSRARPADGNFTLRQGYHNYSSLYSSKADDLSYILSKLENLLNNNQRDSLSRDGRDGRVDVNVNLNVSVNDLTKAVEIIAKEIRQLNQNTVDIDRQGDFSKFLTTGHSKLKTEGMEVNLAGGKLWPRFKNGTETLLTLFTTWGRSEDKFTIYENTLKNWVQLKPHIRAVLFVDGNPKSERLALEAGWEVLQVRIKAKNDLPVLKQMFIDTEIAFNSKFYGYANADILFTRGDLVETLNALDKTESVDNKLTFVTGVRTNVVNVTKTEVVNFESIQRTAKERGEYFITSAEDYFITGRGYPWHEIPELVIGSLAYDNWLVLSARYNKHYVIDATRTILAVHQSRNKAETYQSHYRNVANYNKDIIQSMLYGIYPPFRWGFTNCIELFTMKENSTVLINRRGPFEGCQ